MPQATPVIDINYGAPGYIVNFVLFSALFVFNAVVYIRSRLQAKRFADHCVYLPNENQTQKGYRPSRLGRSCRALSVIFLIWMQCSLIITFLSNYQHYWPYSPGKGEENKHVTWDSFTRAFLLPWITTFLLLVGLRRHHSSLAIFYMCPCSLERATHVKVHSSIEDENGNRQDFEDVVPVSITARNLRMIEWQLLRYVYCSSKDAFTSDPQYDNDDDEGMKVERDITGVWANEMHRKGGVSSEMASVMLDGPQGRNEITVHIPSILEGCVTEFFSFFYIYQFFAVTLSFYWDYVSVGLMMSLLVLTCGVIKVYTERMQRLKMKEMATLDETILVFRDNQWKSVDSHEACVGDILCLTSKLEDEDAENENHPHHRPLLTADCILISGSCVVDESLLTGETMPIQKFAVSEDKRVRIPDSAEHKKHFLFAGTCLLHAGGADQTELPDHVSEGGLAIVTHVGPRSTRGILLRTLLFGSSTRLHIVAEAQFVLALLVFIAFWDFLAVNLNYEFNLSSVLAATFMLISMVSPLLSVAVLGGQLASAQRLNRKKPAKETREQEEGEQASADETIQIYVRDVDRMALAGKIDLMCFDKTGTITKTGLDLIGFLPASNKSETRASWEELHPLEGYVAGGEELDELLAAALALTHTVSRLGKQLIGHQVELRMVEAAEQLGWKYEEGMKAANEWTIVKQWTFDHQTMTMSVLTAKERGDEKKNLVFVKGSFEAVSTRCSPKLDDKWRRAVELHSKRGCYIIAIACKNVDDDQILTISRQQAESSLTFLGLIAFRNEPKVDSADCISQMQHGGVECVMVTGDSALTGVAVAKTVGIIPEDHFVFVGKLDDKKNLSWTQVVSEERKPAGEKDAESGRAAESARDGEKTREEGKRDDERDESSMKTSLVVSGDVFEHLLNNGSMGEFLHCRKSCRVRGRSTCECPRIRVFGRMTPHQKVQVVREFANNMRTVGMCGDGGNDSGALRSAHAGLALSGRAEASVAAPFSTDSDSLAALTLLLREGRASLCTSFAAYRFLIVRGIVWTQAKNIMFLIAGLYLPPLGYLYLDLVSTSLFLWAISLSKPSSRLSPRIPEGSLLGPQNVISATISVLLYLSILGILLAVLFTRSWFKPFQSGDALYKWQTRSDNYESPLFFIWAIWFTVDLAIVYSNGHLYRLPWWKNMALIVVSVLMATPILLLLLLNGTDYNCAFKINCDMITYFKISSSPVNKILFPYERIGGNEWYAPSENTFYSHNFKVVFLVVLGLGSLFHAVVYSKVILGPVVQDWIPNRLKWNDSSAQILFELMSLKFHHVYSLLQTSLFSCFFKFGGKVPMQREDQDMQPMTKSSYSNE
mmetsp:Transcript_6045/g.21337  ORF Transcript_6045/g.21337 Transcript_6045/m.21337 type:complete len:1340 (-) Transcript_6045:129-4148(-)